MHNFGQRLLEYDFLQIAREQDDRENIGSFKHVFQIIFIILFSERAPLEMTYISMSSKVICEGAKRPSGGSVWERVSPLPGEEKFCIWSPKKTVSDAYLGKDN